MRVITFSAIFMGLIVSGCTTIDRDHSQKAIVASATNAITLTPEQSWQSSPSNPHTDNAPQHIPVVDHWLKTLNDERLTNYVNSALNNNRDLQADAAALAAAFESANISASQRRPTVNANAQQNYTQATSSSDYDTSYTHSLSLSWEADIWSKLSVEHQSSVLSAESQQSLYNASELSLVANIARRWFAINADRLKLTIDEKRLANQKNTLSIIEEQYQSGRSGARDVLLSRSDVATQQAAIFSAKDQLEQSIRTFKRLLGEYPNLDLQFDAELPSIDQPLPAGLPSELLLRRPDVVASMKQWQASSLDVESAEKARFPSFALTASYGESSDSLLRINASDLIFSLVNNITVPLFQGGRLQSRVAQAQHLADANFQRYVSTLLTSFEEVESTLGAEKYLQQRLSALKQAALSAEEGYELAFEQYQSGLIEYTDLLDFERRWFSAQSDIVSLQNALLQNRVNIHLALGAPY